MNVGTQDDSSERIYLNIFLGFKDTLSLKINTFKCYSSLYVNMYANFITIIAFIKTFFVKQATNWQS